jgi:uncharacterized protein (TIGR00270 family)
MECEICGNPARNLVEIMFEGQKVLSCPDCAGMGTTIEAKKTIKEKKILAQAEPEAFDLVEGFGTLLRKSREKKSLTIEELARHLFERPSVIQHLEHEKFLPDQKLAGKLEKFFNIKLIKEKEAVEEAE